VNDGLVALQRRLQHEFTKIGLLSQALTHRSFSVDHNERLEFLGDSVLNLAVADLLYERLSALPEGDLSRVRANLVKQDTLHQLAIGLGLAGGDSAGRRRGALWRTQAAFHFGRCFGSRHWCGLPGCRFCGGTKIGATPVQGLEINPEMDAIGKDPKTELQEWLQGRRMKLPQYRVVATLGMAHKQTFDVECEITELGLAERGIGGSRRAGEQAAALAMLQTLKTKAKP
jgi:ribonuclease-3